MKKILINTSLICLLAATLGACKKKLAEDYNNPILTTQPSISGFFTAMLNSDRVRPAYWNLRTFFFPHISIYAQTASFVNGPTAYQQIDGYIGNYWSDFYYPAGNGSGPMALYNSMKATFTTLSDADKANQAVYMQAAKIVLYERTAKMVDMWGDVPFSEAGNLETNSSIKDPKFDDAKTLYDTLMNGLNGAATYFGSATLAGNVQAAFSKGDILLKGSLKQWQRYANSARLRLLMRTSFVNEAVAKAAVTTMLANPTSYPLIDGGGVGTYSPAATDVLLQPLTSTTSSTLYSALTEINSYFATDYMLNKVMLPANDPRIPVMYDKYGRTVNGVFVQNSTYRAMPATYTSGQQDTAYFNYSIVDSTTFLNNIKMPGVVLTAPEVNFLKAEAYERWGLGDATVAYNTAVTQSVYFYYYLNNIGGGTVASPTAGAISTFLAAPNVAYTGTSGQKLANIYIQKWVQFGFLQSDEAWAEYRRTKYPQLTFTVQTLSGYENPPTRLLYPTNETAYNPNYSTVKAKDTRTTKIFWDVK